MGEEGQRGCCSGEDRISGLPDELLHDILVRLGSADAAAGTSVLSRRWRHLWEHMPELRLVAPPAAAAAAAPASFFSTVDAALGGYLAPTLEYLGVSYRTEEQGRNLGIPARRIAPWLHFAAERVVGELNLYLYVPQPIFLINSTEVLEENVVLELPACERAKRIGMHLLYAYATLLRPQQSGLFTALVSLKIEGGVCMEGIDLSKLVSTQCPCLADLDLFISLAFNFDVLMHSNTLQTLKLQVSRTGRLEVVATRLEEITILNNPMEAHISAPKLVKVAWLDNYDPHVHPFVDVGRTLQLLKTSKWASSLTKKFDEVDELDMRIDLDYWPDETDNYGIVMSETNKLPKCKSFCVFLSWDYHAVVPVMLHLLRSCTGTKKLQLRLCGFNFPDQVNLCDLPSCPCRLEESHKIDGIDLSSLEEVEIIGFEGCHEHMELVEVICSIAGMLKRLVVNDGYCRRPKEAREKVRGICHPNVTVEFCGLR